MDLVTGLSLGRVGLGAAALARPASVATLLGIGSTAARSGPAPAQSVVARLFGVREVALGVTTLLASPAAQPLLLTSGVLVDLGDAAACLAGRRSGDLSGRVAGPALAVALGAAAVGALEGRRRSSGRR